MMFDALIFIADILSACNNTYMVQINTLWSSLRCYANIKKSTWFGANLFELELAIS